MLTVYHSRQNFLICVCKAHSPKISQRINNFVMNLDSGGLSLLGDNFIMYKEHRTYYLSKFWVCNLLAMLTLHFLINVP